MDNSLDSFVKRNQKFLKLTDEESIKVIYRGFLLSADPRNPEKEKVTYKLQPVGGEKVLFMSSASVSLARRMAHISEGEMIVLTRHGEGTATSYEVNEQI